MARKFKNLFTSIGAAIAHIFKGVGGYFVKGFKTWKRRFTDMDELYNYFSAEWTKHAFVLLYILVNLFLFVEAGARNFHGARLRGAPALACFYLMMARGFGQLLNFNCAIILLPVLRTILTIIRSFKFGVVAPLDKNIVFHRFIAYNIVISGVLHGLAHYFNYACCANLYSTAGTVAGAWNNINAAYPVHAAFGTKYGITGHLLWLVMVPLYASANKSYRRSKNFTIFWYTHHFFVPFYILLLIHGRFFWMWFLGPGCMYLVERFMRNIRGQSYTVVKRVHAQPSKVIVLDLDKPSFRYKAGQYCFLNCPLISRSEWHPFTISSAPSEEYLTFHIKVLGDWTNSLMEVFNPAKRDLLMIDKPTTPDGNNFLIRVDGPFGTSADEVFDFEYVMLISTGIGVTPYTSLIKDISHRRKTGKNLHLKRVSFYWMNRDEGSWEWFSDILNRLEAEDPDFFDIHTFMTGQLTSEQAKQIMFTSQEYQDNKTDKQAKLGVGVKLKAKAVYSYEPQAADELELQEGDVITVTRQDDSGWWSGINDRNKKEGNFPGNYVVIVDAVTKMVNSTKRKFGRPDWKEEFGHVRSFIESKHPESVKPNCGVFLCGPSALSKALAGYCLAESKNSTVKFVYHKENF